MNGVVEIEVINSPGNIARKIKLCEGQLPADAAADYLLTQGMHDELYNPFETEYRYIVARLCEEVTKSGSISADIKRICHNSNPHVTPFIDPNNAFVTLHFYDKSHLLKPGDEEPFRVRAYLRYGYDAIFHTKCICSKIDCSPEEMDAVAQFMHDSIPAPGVF